MADSVARELTVDVSKLLENRLEAMLEFWVDLLTIKVPGGELAEPNGNQLGLL